MPQGGYRGTRTRTRVTRGPGLAAATAWRINPAAFERFADYGAAEVTRRREVRARMLALGVTTMLSVLCSGTLTADPKSRTSAKGKDYATASLRVPAEDAEAMLVSVIVFNADAVAALLALTKGDACAIAGRAKLTSWERDGEEKHGLSVVADQVLTIYQIEKRRKRATEGSQDDKTC